MNAIQAMSAEEEMDNDEGLFGGGKHREGSKRGDRNGVDGEEGEGEETGVHELDDGPFGVKQQEEGEVVEQDDLELDDVLHRSTGGGNSGTIGRAGESEGEIEGFQGAGLETHVVTAGLAGVGSDEDETSSSSSGGGGGSNTKKGHSSSGTSSRTKDSVLATAHKVLRERQMGGNSNTISSLSSSSASHLNSNNNHHPHRHELANADRQNQFATRLVGGVIWLLVILHILALVIWIRAWMRQRKSKDPTMRAFATGPPQKVGCSYDMDKSFSIPKIELPIKGLALKQAKA